MTLAFLVAALLAGVLVGFRVDADPLPLLFLLLATPALGLVLRLTGRSLWPAALAGVFLLAVLRVEASGGPGPKLVTRDGESVALQGRVSNDPEATARKVRFVLTVEAVNRGEGWQALSSKALVYADPPASLVSGREAPYFRYGDTLRLEGVLEAPQPFGGFDYPTYLASQGIQGILWSREAELTTSGERGSWRRWVFDLRRSLAESLEDALPASHAALAQALLLGLRGGLPAEVTQDFRNTGTSHLLAVSGLNVAIVLAMSVGAAAWLVGRRRQLYLLLPLAAIWVYALLTGLAPPVERAAIMGSIYLGALALGRPRSALPALAFAAAVMAALDPRMLTRVDFQLSFAAMAGIVLALPYQSRVGQAIAGDRDGTGGWWQRWGRYLWAWVLTGLLISAAATLATLPLVAFNFQRIPLFGVVVTLLTLPVLPFILLGSLATALAGLVAPALGQVLGWITWVPLSYLLGLVSLSPGTVVSGSWVGGHLVWAWYVLLGGALLLPSLLSRWRGRALRAATFLKGAARQGLGASRPSGPTVGLLGLALVLAVAGTFLWVQIIRGPEGRLHVYFFDVGQGDSILIVTPRGRQVLVDGGPEAGSATQALAGAISLGDRSLDLVALTHLDADHGRGLLEVLDRYRVAAVLVGLEDPESSLYPQWRAALDRQQIRAIPLSTGYRIILEEGVALQVLNPPARPFQGSSADRNNNGLVLRLEYGNASFLLAADIQALAESHLVNTLPALESVVLKVPHHGSRTSTTAEFLSRVNPSQVVISAGAQNQYGHPHPQVMARLRERPAGTGIYQTSERGRIEFVSDGRRLWVKTQR